MAVPPPDETPGPPPDDLPVHRRTIGIDVFERPGSFEVAGTLRDERPWASGTDRVEVLHDMELRLTVRRSDLVVTEARAVMHRFPHAECPRIEAAFGGLVGLSVSRGFTRAVQERFGRTRGCSHLEFLARSLGPAIVQAIPSSAVRQPGELQDRLGTTGTGWLSGTCHVWAADGPGERKLAAGWRPGIGGYPAPPAEELERRPVRIDRSRSGGGEAPSSAG